jgi:hypothetical protein
VKDVHDIAPQLLLIGLSAQHSSCGVGQNFPAAVFPYRQMWQDTVLALNSFDALVAIAVMPPRLFDREGRSHL